MNIDSSQDRILQGEIFFRSLFRLLQTVKLHQSRNPLLLDRVKEFVEAILSTSKEDSLTLQISRGQFYLQEEKIVCRTQNLTLMKEILHYFQQRSLPGIRFHPSVREAASGQIISFAHLLNQAEHREAPPGWLQEQLQKGNCSWVEIVFPADTGPVVQLSVRGERARRAYSHAMTSMREVSVNMTAPRIYRPVALSPDRVLAMMIERAGTDYDPLILKVFIQMLGVYPVGTLLRLDTGEIGLVTACVNGEQLAPRYP